MKESGLQVRGFTIIETSLVIAIGGLILLMVFVALPALQRQQRDTSRRESVSRVISEIKNYQTHNRGSLPILSAAQGGEIVEWSESGTSGNGDSWGDFYKSYLGDNFMDPDGERYVLHVIKCDASKKGAASNGRTEGALDGDERAGDGENRATEIECPSTATGGVANVSDKNFPNEHHMSVVIGATCRGAMAISTANPRNVAVLYKLEGAGEYCATSSN